MIPTILVIEDNILNLELVRDLLITAGIKVRSSGLGLTFCKLAVEAHGGRIGVDDHNGGGARFWIELPPQLG